MPRRLLRQERDPQADRPRWRSPGRRICSSWRPWHRDRELSVQRVPESGSIPLLVPELVEMPGKRLDHVPRLGEVVAGTQTRMNLLNGKSRGRAQNDVNADRLGVDVR